MAIGHAGAMRLVRAMSIVAAGVLLAALLTTIAPLRANAATFSESEPNGTMASANVIALGSSVSGVAFQPRSYYDVDYFAYDAPSGGRANINFTFPSGLGTGSGYSLQIFDQSGVLLYEFYPKAGEWSGGAIRNNATYVPAGRFYIGLRAGDDNATWGKEYRLDVSVTPGPAETEPNGTTEGADLVPLGATVAGSSLRASYFDNDYFAYDVPAAGRASIDLTFPSGLGTGSAYDVSVYDQYGNTLYDFYLRAGDWNGAALRTMATFVPQGRVYVRVGGSDDDATWGKRYALKLSVAPGSVETEMNNATDTADVITLGTAVSGSSLSSSYFDNDYFALDIPAAGRANLGFTFPAGLGTGRAYDLDIYDEYGNALYDFSLNAADSSGSWTSAQPLTLPAGRIYMRVHGSDDWSTWGKGYFLALRMNLITAPTPQIAGTGTVGSALTALVGSWAPAPVTLSYQWKRDGVAISGATAKTYLPVAADAGRNVTVTVTGSRAGYLPISRTSSAKKMSNLQTLTSAPVPQISGTGNMGSALTALVGSWGPAPVSLAYQWFRDGAPIAGATGKTYSPVAADAGKNITVRVTGSKSGYTSVARTSAPKAMTALLTKAPTPLISGTGRVNSALTALVGTWAPAPVTLSYQWYRNGNAIPGATAKIYMPTAADAGKSITVKVTGSKQGYTPSARLSAAFPIRA